MEGVVEWSLERVGSTTPFVYTLPRDREMVRKPIKLIVNYLYVVSHIIIHSFLLCSLVCLQLGIHWTPII